MGILQARILAWVAMPSSRGSSQSRDQTQVSCNAGGFLPSEPPWKSMNTGVGSLSLLQGIFMTWELDWGLQLWRQILCQLSYQGSPERRFSSVQFSFSVMSDSSQPMNHSTPGHPVQHQLSEFTQTHVHRVSDAIQPSHPLLSPFPPAPNPSHICRAAVATQTYRTDLWTPGERRG